MKLNFDNIQNPVIVDIYNITGQLPVPARKVGAGNFNVLPIEIRKRLGTGWTADLVILVDGVKVHQSEASEEDRDAYAKLYNRAVQDACVKHEQKRASILAQVEAAKLW